MTLPAPLATTPGTPYGAASAAGPSAPLSLRDQRGLSYPIPGQASPGEVVDYVWRLFQAQDADCLLRYKTAALHLLMADGRQHVDWNTRERMWLDSPSVEGRVQATMNYIRPVLRSRSQRILSAEMRWRSSPANNTLKARDRATLAEKLVDHRYDACDLDGKLRTCLWLADCCGVAFLKSFWNPSIGALTPATLILPHPASGKLEEYPVDASGQPLIDPSTGDPLGDVDGAYLYRPGDTDTGVRTLFNLRVNPEAWGFTPAEGFRWLIDAESVPISVVKERFGAIAKDLLPNDPLPQIRQYERLLRAMAGRPSSMTPTAGMIGPNDGNMLPDNEVTMLQEYWEEPSEPMPDGRLVVVAGRTLMYDGPLPQGFVPYVPVYSERKPFDPYGHPVVAEMVSPQRNINTQWSVILEELKRDAVGQFIGFDVPGMFDQLTNIDGSFVKIPFKSNTMNRSIGDLIQRMPHAQINEARLAVIDRARAAIFDFGAFHEIQRGQVPPGVDSGVAVQMLQEAENAQLDDTVRTLKSSLILWGRHQLALARWGYGPQEARWLPSQEADLGYLVEGVSGADLPDPDTVSLDLEGFKPTSEAARRAEITDLATRQLISGDQMFRLLDLGRGIEGLYPSQSRHYNRARAENLAFQKGEYRAIVAPPTTPADGTVAMVFPDGSPFLLPADDDDEIHIAVHQDLALDNAMPWPMRQNVLLHIAEHRQNMQSKAAAMAAAMAPPGPPVAAPRSNAPVNGAKPQLSVVRG